MLSRDEGRGRGWRSGWRGSGERKSAGRSRPPAPPATVNAAANKQLMLVNEQRQNNAASTVTTRDGAESDGQAPSAHRGAAYLGRNAAPTRTAPPMGMRNSTSRTAAQHMSGALREHAHHSWWARQAGGGGGAHNEWNGAQHPQATSRPAPPVPHGQHTSTHRRPGARRVLASACNQHGNHRTPKRCRKKAPSPANRTRGPRGQTCLTAMKTAGKAETDTRRTSDHRAGPEATHHVVRSSATARPDLAPLRQCGTRSKRSRELMSAQRHEASKRVTSRAWRRKEKLRNSLQLGLVTRGVFTTQKLDQKSWQTNTTVSHPFRQGRESAEESRQQKKQKRKRRKFFVFSVSGGNPVNRAVRQPPAGRAQRVSSSLR
jgi:hypothetical protein